MNYKSLLFIALIILLNPCISFSQEKFNIEWGQSNIPRGDVNNIIGIDGNDFHVLYQRTQGAGLFLGNNNDFTISRVQDYKTVQPIKLKLRGDGRVSNLEGLMDFKESIFALSSSTSFSSKTNKLFYHLFPKNNMVGENEGIKIAEYEFKDVGNNRDIFQYNFSQDTSKLGVIFEIKGNRNSAAEFGYVILNDSMKSISAGNHILNYNTWQLDFIDHYVSNTGALYVIAKEYRKRNNSGSWDKFNRAFSQMKLFKVDKKEIKDLNINNESRSIKELKMAHTSDDGFICSGFYGLNQNDNVIGAFSLTLDANSDTLSKWSNHVFNTSIQNQMRTDSRAFIISSEVFKLQELNQTNDGGFVGTSEVNYTEEIQRNSANGAIQSEYHFNSNAILNYKIDSTGNITWCDFIPKIQYSVNDRGDFLSHAKYLKKDKMYFLFNDDDDNYTDDYSFDFPTNLYQMNANARRNVMAVVEVDLKTGAQTRYQIGDRKTFGTVLVPRVSQVDTKNGTLIIYGRTAREQFGRIAFH